MARDPYSSNKAATRQGGFLGTHKQDFESHWRGTSYKHNASQIETVNGTLQDTVDQLNSGLMSSLRNIVGKVNGEIRHATGYSVAGDGGEGWFSWNSGSCTDNDGTILNSGGFGSTVAGGWHRIYSGPLNVKWFGGGQAGDVAFAFNHAIAAADTLGGETVFISGTFDISSSIDMSTILNQVILEGSEAVLNVSAYKGIVLGSNAKILNIKFNYNPIGIPYTPSDRINAGNGCIYSGSLVLNDVKIERCEFFTDSLTQLAPLINIHATATSIWNRINISYNRFFTSSTTSQAAIAFTNATSGGTIPTLARNIKIENNYCTSYQGIYMTSVIYRPGLSCSNCEIRGNNCGIIGIMTSGADTTVAFHPAGLKISNNTCQFIGNLAILGGYIPANYMTYGIGNVWASNNRCSWIALSCINHPTAPIDRGTLTIDGNHLSPQDQTFITSDHSYSYNIGIFVDGYDFLSGGQADAIIVNNATDMGYINSVQYTYDIGISTAVGGMVANNVVRGLGTGSFGIKTTGTSTFINLQIHDNQIYRNGVDLGAFVIGTEVVPALGKVFVIDNFFDFSTVDLAGTDFDLVKFIGQYWTIYRNKNQIITRTIRHRDGGIFTYSSGLTDGYASPPNNNVLAFMAKQSDYSLVGFTASLRTQITTGTDERFEYSLLLDEIIPEGALFVSATATVAVNNIANWVSPSVVSLSLMEKAVSGIDSTVLDTDSIDIGAIASKTLTLSTYAGAVKDTYLLFSPNTTVYNSSGGDRSIYSSAITIKYKW